MFLRLSQFSLRSIADLMMRSTSRSKRILSSSCICRVSVSPRFALGAKVTRMSMSLSGRKSSRKTEPNNENSAICQRWQNSAIAVMGSSMADAIMSAVSPLTRGW